MCLCVWIMHAYKMFCFSIFFFDLFILLFNTCHSLKIWFRQGSGCHNHLHQSRNLQSKCHPFSIIYHRMHITAKRWWLLSAKTIFERLNHSIIRVKIQLLDNIFFSHVFLSAQTRAHQDMLSSLRKNRKRKSVFII